MTAKAHDRDRNGSGPLRAYAVAGATYDDPMSRVLGIGAESSGAGAWAAYTAGALALMAALLVVAQAMSLIFNMRLPFVSAVTQEIEVSAEEAPPPPPPPPKVDERAKPEPAAPPPPPARALLLQPPPEAPPAPPPAPAQAGKVLTQEPNPEEPVDLTGNTIVAGSAETYAGGTTASNGTSTQAVHGPAIAQGGPNQVQAAPPGPDRSRRASFGGAGEWNCPFPAEADTAQIDEAYVTIEVDVRADGMASAVRLLSDPGNGFGREARRCAMTRRWQPALDRDGNAINGAARLRVHFSR